MDTQPRHQSSASAARSTPSRWLPRTRHAHRVLQVVVHLLQHVLGAAPQNNRARLVGWATLRTRFSPQRVATSLSVSRSTGARWWRPSSVPDERCPSCACGAAPSHPPSSDRYCYARFAQPFSVTTTSGLSAIVCESPLLYSCAWLGMSRVMKVVARAALVVHDVAAVIDAVARILKARSLGILIRHRHGGARPVQQHALLPQPAFGGHRAQSWLRLRFELASTRDMGMC